MKNKKTFRTRFCCIKVFAQSAIVALLASTPFTLTVASNAVESITPKLAVISGAITTNASGFYVANVSSLFGYALYSELGKLMYEQETQAGKNITLVENKTKTNAEFLLYFADERLIDFQMNLRQLNSTNNAQSIATSLHSKIANKLKNKELSE